MAQLNILRTTKILIDDPYLIQNWRKFADYLDCPASVIHPLQNQWRTGTLTTYELFHRILENWLFRTGRPATTENLINILEQLEFRSCAEHLREKPIGVVIDNDPVQQGSYWSQFRALKILGNGSYGIVFLVQKKHHERSAIKLVVPLPSKERDVLEDAKREFETMAKFNHEHIVSLYHPEVLERNSGITETFVEDIGGRDSFIDTFLRNQYDTFIALSENNPTVCIQMELCGETLRQWLNDVAVIREKSKTRIDFTFAKTQIEIAQGIVAGLKYLHTREPPILHRDIKPGNIFFSLAEGKYNLPIKIGDFGISREVPGGVTQTMTRNRGTDLYMAREVRYKPYGMKADLYSLGLVLLEIFQYIAEKDLPKVFDDLVIDKDTSIIRGNNHFVKNLKELIVKLTQKDDDKRLASIELAKLEFTEEYRSQIARIGEGGFEKNLEEGFLC